MKVLWLCNLMLPAVARHLGLKATNKEGWISGTAEVILKNSESNAVQLAIAFPVSQEMDGYHETLELFGGKLECFGFYEDSAHPENYDSGLEERLRKITDSFQPDVIHCYGTEYPHTLAMCKAYPRKERILISIQGLCSVYANTYFADLPEKCVKTVTFRDWLKKDSLMQQKEKYVKRGGMEIDAVKLAGNVAGRTAWDAFYTNLWNPRAEYFKMNETLRSCFYQDKWSRENAVPHTIFLSQGNYPIKGLHYMLQALPEIKKVYPDVKVSVAGDSIIRYETWKDKIKISAYGKYLRSLISKYGLEENVEFLGQLTADEMKAQYLRSSMFVCCSTIENSPNSLGEAMILGVPCVSADMGGVSSIFADGEDGILYPGFRTKENAFDLPYCERDVQAGAGCGESACKAGGGEDTACSKCANSRLERSACGKRASSRLERNAADLAKAVLRMWSEEEKQPRYCENARAHALKTHDREENYRRMLEIYAEISRK